MLWKAITENGAPWRVVFDQCFGLLLIGALPVLVLALTRRLRAEQRAAATLRAREAQPPPDGGPDAGVPDSDQNGDRNGDRN